MTRRGALRAHMLLKYTSMRPSILDPLFGRAGALPGVGPKTAKLFDRLLAKPGEEARVVDLLFHLPINVIDRSARPTIAEAPLDTMVVLKVRVAEHRKPQGRYSKAPFKVLVEDETGDVELVFFLANPDWIERSLPHRRDALDFRKARAL